MDAILDATGDLPIVFPAHPRTAERLKALPRVQAEAKGRLKIVEPLGYLEFLSLLTTARIVLTDSGGLQEETTVLGVPCVTLRENTERPITLEHGANRLAGVSRQGILEAVGAALALEKQAFPAPEFWDGKAAERIVEVLARTQ
jgi:UDP-N-acetylglucosamine 2-epimerase (non-hydrolysing)